MSKKTIAELFAEKSAPVEALLGKAQGEVLLIKRKKEESHGQRN